MSNFEPTNGDHDGIHTETGLIPVREAVKSLLSLRYTKPGTQIRVHAPEGPATSAPSAGSIRRGLEAHIRKYPLEVIPPR